jgi:two-component system phosphate regulon sensor histidine kinase PhoR
LKIRINFGLKAALLYSAIALLILVALGGVFSFYGERVYLEGRNALLIKEARTAAQLLSNLPQDVLKSNAPFYAREIAVKSGMRVTLIDSQGNVLGDSTTEASNLENHLNRPEVQEALKGEVGLERRYSTTENQKNLYVAVPVQEKPPVSVVLRLSVPTSIWDADLGKIQAFIWLSVGSGFFLFLVLSLLTSGIIRKPLLELTNALQAFRKGEVSWVKSSRSDEVGQIAQEVNSLIAQLNALSSEVSALEEKWKAYLEKEEDGVLILNNKWEVLQSSLRACQILGFTERQLLGRTLLESTLNYNLAQAAKKAVEDSTIEKVSLDSRILSLTGALLRSSEGEYAILWLKDLTEIERLRSVKRDFVANVSHELKTPVSSLKIMLETVLQEATSLTEVERDFLQRSYKEVEYLQSLIEALTKLSLIESGKVSFKIELLDLSPLLQELHASLKERAQKQGIEFQIELPPEPLLIKADFSSLREAFLAILDNAFKFTPSGREVQIKAFKQGEWIEVRFRDQGVGIAREDLPRIFERFYKVDKSRGTPGFGIGLSLAKHIVESFSGSISAFSEEGKGALFIVRFPAAQI